jgi:4-hydroxyproline epimerase
MRSLQIVDSHTEGEPTRCVVGGAPDLGMGTMKERMAILKSDHDWVRSTAVNEPRGSDAVVGALLCEPVDPAFDAGVIFFNNMGYLQMCGHGTIGLVRTLQHLGRLKRNVCRIETSVGPVTATVREDGAVTIENVPSYRAKKDVAVQVEGIGEIKGDVAWGGNWFYLTKDVGVEVTKANLAKLTDVALRIREALNNTHPEVDHIEIFGPPEREDADSRNFVLCPGGAYDRSPCGTGTSAKLACLYADGVISEGQIWRQESIIGSLLEGSVRVLDGDLIPSISGRAYITSEATLLMDEADPFCFGI